MKHLAILLLLIGAVGAAHAQSDGLPPPLPSPAGGGGYGVGVEWNTIDNGGATFASGGGYELGGTIGQPDAGVLGHASGVPYTLSGGFWVGGRIPTPPEYRIFLPLVVRNSS